jgi:hypothetical protein
MAGVMGQAAVGDSMGNHAASKQQRQQATAAAIGSRVEWFSVKVSGVRKHGNSVSWTARTPLGQYTCSEELGETVAACTEPPGNRSS